MRIFIERLMMLAAAVSAFGCTRNLSAPETCNLDLVFSVERMVTKSLLPENSSYEDAINDVTLLLYGRNTGFLEGAKYITGGRGSITVDRNREYTIYVFANMGDLTGRAPIREADVKDIGYRIPSFEALESTGIPMSGVATSDAGTTVISVSLRRLLAKLLVKADYSEMGSAGDPQGFAGGTLCVNRAARTLYPFAEGGSRALAPDDVFQSAADRHTIADALKPVSEEIVLYVPENMQGNLLEDNTNPLDKSESSGRFDPSLCTYISFDGVKIGDVDGVDGRLIYRFFPGKDDTSNFDLAGGVIYHVLLKLSWDGMFITGNWQVSKSSWSDSREITLSANPDGPYASVLTLDLPPGTERYPFHIHYSTDNQDFTGEGTYGHKTYGWTFTSENITAADNESTQTSSDGIEYGFSAHEPSGTRHFITIPPDESLTGKTLKILYHTTDRRHTCLLIVNIVAPPAENGFLTIEKEENGGNVKIEY